MVETLLSILFLIIGMGLLIKGADLFVEGSASVAKTLKIPPLVIGLTLVSIGTSAPELSVSLVSSLQGLNDMSFGNIVGSNIFNTFVVIGVSAIITPLLLSKNMKRYDIPILIGIYLLLTLFSFVISPNILNLWESIIIFSLTIIYIVFLILRSKKESNNDADTIKERKWYVNLIFIVLGLAGIIFGGDFVVETSSILAKKMGMSEMLVGLTIVAVGTSLPELTTSIVAARKGQNDIAIGNAIGSCIFNIILILGICSIIEPMIIAPSSLFDLIIMLISVLVLFSFSFKSNKVVRWQGIIMALIYVGYIVIIVLRNIII